MTKKRHAELIGAPQMQYLSIYKQTAKRLSTFEQIASDNEDSDEDSFFGSATDYDNFLDLQIKKARMVDQEQSQMMLQQ